MGVTDHEASAANDQREDYNRSVWAERYATALADFPLDIPTALTRDESALLQEIAEGNRVLEIGALLGYSTVTLARTARWVVSVDPHEGYPAHDPRPTLDTYLENLRRNAVTNVVPVIARWQDALDAIRPTSFDVVFMDLTGRYEDTKELLDHLRLDFATGLIGAIAVHDCGHPDWPGVQQAVQEFHRETGGTMKVVDRLAVFQ